MTAIDRDGLFDALRRGHRAPKDRRLGIEFEQFVVRPNGDHVPYLGDDGVEATLRQAQTLTGWKPKEESGHLLALKAPDGRMLTLEPGAQLEFGSSPCHTLDEVAAEVDQYCSLLRTLSERSGFGFLALGSHPTAAPDDIVRLPKERYDVLEPWLMQADELGLWMMKTTCGVQVNFDHTDEEDAMAKLRICFALAPVFNAMFANSAIRAGRPSDYASWRGHIWTKVDNSRCGIIESLTREGTTFDDYVEWVLDVPMLFIERDGKQVDMRNRSFRDWMADGHATAADWDLHLSTPFPEVRFRPQVELRSTDSVPPALLLSLAALVQGVFYNADSQQRAWELTADWSHEQRLHTWAAAHRDGLAAIAPDGRPLLAYARELVGMAQLNAADRRYLQPLEELLEDGRSLGERLQLAMQQPDWSGNVLPLVAGSCCAQVAEVAIR